MAGKFSVAATRVHGVAVPVGQIVQTTTLKLRHISSPSRTVLHFKKSGIEINILTYTVSQKRPPFYSVPALA